MKKLKIQTINKKCTSTVKKLNYNSNNFIILDDDTEIDKQKLNLIIKEINKYDYKVNIVYMKSVATTIINYIKNNCNCLDGIDSIVLLGEGGKRFFKYLNMDNTFSNKEVLCVKWSRYWKGNNSKEFETNIDDFDIEGKRFLIVEDVVASGQTLLNIYEYIKKHGGKIELLITCLIQESSPLVNKSFVPTIAGEVIKKPDDSGQDPFWYPPIYSLRHLLYGDEEMPNIYSVLNNKYFNDENIVENKIKELR